MCPMKCTGQENAAVAVYVTLKAFTLILDWFHKTHRHRLRPPLLTFYTFKYINITLRFKKKVIPFKAGVCSQRGPRS